MMVFARNMVDTMKLEAARYAGVPLRVMRNGRRYFSAEHKRAVIERCLAPGASVSAVSLEHGFNASLVLQTDP